ncbi:hypothetical protein M2137_002990 [Parabacteroides sp. PFB2-10]|uniref:winged helix DNA-binding domain-containing protein n=1 Tax=Parabacteroides sp. PFB2-10 TaxID=1742405 RepID=UPI0024761BE7|nr:winged helix DNA-binding domain-containing protein [Parabacteroides sp. PFB2-10]MDH6314196.1 hypothetical protein [Parabacteroides sp. PFB2-10]
MNPTDILQIRLHNQLLAGNQLKEPHEVVSYMGAMQSQASEMAKWGIGNRLEGATYQRVTEALDAGRIIRTHILRPTWHFVSAEDIHWMIELSFPHLKPVFFSYARMIGIDEADLPRKRVQVINTLEKQGHLTKQEIDMHLKNEGIEIDERELSIILSQAEIEGIVCNGVAKGIKHTYALLEERTPKTRAFVKEEALAMLAYRFFSSHGPATLHDFIWWSGLLITEARSALELVKEQFVSETLNGREFWMKNDIRIPEKGKDAVLLLPPFDEFVVSYKDRSELIENEHYGKVMTKNGLFSPTVMLNGRIIGSWKKVTKKKAPEVEVSFFKKASRKTEQLVEVAIKEYLRFL